MNFFKPPSTWRNGVSTESLEEKSNFFKPCCTETILRTTDLLGGLVIPEALVSVSGSRGVVVGGQNPADIRWEAGYTLPIHQFWSNSSLLISKWLHHWYSVRWIQFNCTTLLRKVPWDNVCCDLAVLTGAVTSAVNSWIFSRLLLYLHAYSDKCNCTFIHS